MSKRVFLSGAVQGLPDLGMTWREEAEGKLLAAGFRVVQPASSELIDRSAEEIVERNIFLQKTCDLLLVEYTIDHRPYVGTDFELTMASVWGQPALVWASEFNANRIYLQYLATGGFFPSLNEAIDHIIEKYSHGLL